MLLLNTYLGSVSTKMLDLHFYFIERFYYFPLNAYLRNMF